MARPPRLRVRTFYTLCALVVVMLACASRLDNRGHFKPTTSWADKPCNIELFQGAHRILQHGGGHPGAAMYYYRCKPHFVRLWIEYIEDKQRLKSRREGVQK
jgi:hypothetical protein